MMPFNGTTSLDAEEITGGGEVDDPPIHDHSGYPDAQEHARERGRVGPLLAGDG
jgi:hypothetical protein